MAKKKNVKKAARKTSTTTSIKRAVNIKRAVKTSTKAATKTSKRSMNNATKKYSFLDDIHEQIMEIAEVTKKGEVRIKRTDLKKTLEEVFQNAAVRSAGGERVRFPLIGTLVRKEVKALKAGKYMDPFTKEERMRTARPASKKPRWSFPKALKETFATKKHW